MAMLCHLEVVLGQTPSSKARGDGAWLAPEIWHLECLDSDAGGFVWDTSRFQPWQAPRCAWITQVPILFSGAAFFAASAVEVLMYSAAGAYVGFLYGSAAGTLHALRWSYASTVKLPLAVLAWGLRGAGKTSGQLCSFYNSRGQAVSFLAQIALIKTLFKGR